MNSSDGLNQWCAPCWFHFPFPAFPPILLSSSTNFLPLVYVFLPLWGIRTNIYWVFTICCELSKHFTCVKPFHCHNNPVDLAPFLTPFYKWGNRHREVKCHAEEDIPHAPWLRVGTTFTLLPYPWAKHIADLLMSVREEGVGVTALAVMHLALPLSGFMTYIVEPLFQEWARFTGNSALSENMLSHLAHNKAQWKSLLPKQHRSSGGGCAGGSPDHTDHGTESEEQTVTEGIAP